MIQGPVVVLVIIGPMIKSKITISGLVVVAMIKIMIKSLIMISGPMR